MLCVLQAVNPPIPDSTKVQLKGVVLSMRGTGAVYVYAGGEMGDSGWLKMLFCPSLRCGDTENASFVLLNSLDREHS